MRLRRFWKAFSMDSSNLRGFVIRKYVSGNPSPSLSHSSCLSGIPLLFLSSKPPHFAARYNGVGRFPVEDELTVNVCSHFKGIFAIVSGVQDAF